MSLGRISMGLADANLQDDGSVIVPKNIPAYFADAGE